VAHFHVVIDTNVFYAGLRSQLGASHRVLREIGRNAEFQIHLSVPLALEYEAIARRHARTLGLSYQDIDDILDYLGSVAGLHDVFYLWRPFLPDPEDDMLLELAVEAGCNRIVTFNVKDFAGIEQFGLKAVGPHEFLKQIGVLP
jgi:putative PIN family toxin of toxin-antitoxin system